jgi:DNA ligase-1
MKLIELVSTSQRIAETSRRLEKIELLAALLRRLSPEEVEISAHYLSGSLRQGRIGIGYAALRSSLDAGTAATPLLDVIEVDRAFEAIAAAGGKGSSRIRAEMLRELMSRAAAQEKDFLIRLVIGELRQGSMEGIMIEAVARASGIPAAKVRRGVMVCGNLAEAASTALSGGESVLERFAIKLFSPLQPMLAQTAEDVGCALEELGRAAIEFKLDGARIQAHKSGDEVRIFTRALNEVTPAVPELVEMLRRAPAREVILDGEAIALRDDGRPQPFQVTMRRFGRRLRVEEQRRSLPLAPFFFDCLHLDGESLIDRPAAERFAALGEAVVPESVIPRIVTNSAEKAGEFAVDAFRAGHEGVMAKSLEAPYEAGGRGKNWLKIKRARTLDLLVLAAEWGHGRRRGWLSNLHLGARDAQSGQFVMLGKTFKGLTDAMLEWQTRRLLELERGRDDWTVWVHPGLVVEVAFNDIQASPHYPAGIALRFARVKRYREDKTPEQVDTIDTVRGSDPNKSFPCNS